MNKFFLHHPSSSSSSWSSRRALHATQHDWCSDRARIIIIVVAHAPIDSDIELLLGHHERCVSTTNNPSNASDGRDERRDRSVTGVWCARRGMPRARAHRHPSGAARASDGRGREATYRTATHHAHGAKSPFNAHVAAAVGNLSTSESPTPWTTKKQGTRVTLDVPSDKPVYDVSNTHVEIFMRGRHPSRARSPFRGTRFMSIARARARAYCA